ncbi:MAG: hypothetical protein MR285_07170 [Peptoniphilus sp.]|uniref:hypothetical protein n=1 Tax=Peptoniphilus sp. TaxID=1971214 RepID=UPI0025DA3251|nr:hypothetical protein [Peptoniphilus sp.]MCI5643872.1 hypothetical protein [Peptoniphilus sp.]MDY3902186.1 hypothetical protein [Peptoniphilus sp.]
MKEKKIIVDGINFYYDDLVITDDVMENIKDFLEDLEDSRDEVYNSFYIYEDNDNIIIY